MLLGLCLTVISACSANAGNPYEEGVNFLRKGDLQQAEKKCSEATNTNEWYKKAAALNCLGEVYLNQKKLNESEKFLLEGEKQYYTNTLEASHPELFVTNDSFVKNNLLLAKLYLQKKQCEKALYYLDFSKKIISTSPNKGEAFLPVSQKMELEIKKTCNKK